MSSSYENGRWKMYEGPNTMSLAGVMAALATPLDEVEGLDDHGLEKLVAHIVSYPVSGICPAGSTGEGPLLDRATRFKLTSAVSRLIPSGVWNIPAAMSNVLNDVIEDIRAYEDAGAHAVLVTPPFYYQHDAAAIRRWYEAVVSSSALPIVLYNIPSFTKLSIPADVVAHLATDPRVIGMKDSSRDMEYFENILRVTSQASFSLLTGSDTLLLASGVVGGSGTIAASVNLVPQVVTSLWDAIVDGSLETAKELQVGLLQIVQVCRQAGFPSGWKAALSLQGRCSSKVAFPNLSVSKSDLGDLGEKLREAGVALAKEN